MERQKAMMRKTTRSKKNEDDKLWLCSDVVDWRMPKVAAAYKWSMDKNALGIDRLAGVVGVAAAVGLWVARPDVGVSVSAISGALASCVVYWAALFIGLEAECAAYGVLAHAGKQWKAEVESSGGQVDQRALSLISGHMAHLAVSSELQASLATADRAPEIEDGRLSMFKGLCLVTASECARVFGGKANGWIRLREGDHLDHELLSQALVPSRVARREGLAIEAAMQDGLGAGQLLVSKKKRRL
jgi:hypothetical protein